MSILILSVPYDMHAVVVQWGLDQLGIASTLWDWEQFPCAGHASWALDSTRPATVAWTSGAQKLAAPFDVVWYRRAAKPLPSPDCHPDDFAYIQREANAFLNGLTPFLGRDKAAWINYPADAITADNKMLQLLLAREVGFTIPASMTGNDIGRVRQFFAEHNGRVVYKGFSPNNWANLDGSFTTTRTAALTAEHLADDYAVTACPGIYQALIEKQYELRVTVMDGVVLAAAIDSQQSGATVDWRADIPEQNLPLRAVKLPDQVEKMCIALCRRMNLVFGALDLIVGKAGEYIFLEVNEAGQFLWQEQIEPGLLTLDTFCRMLAQRAGLAIPHPHPTLHLADWRGSASQRDYLDCAAQAKSKQSGQGG
jgi:glutathione synthase/RimK-type ligase-like ATP-grasp enzyme